MRSLKYVLLPERPVESRGPLQAVGDRVPPAETRAKRNQRTQFLAFYSCIVQLFFMWILSRA